MLMIEIKKFLKSSARPITVAELATNFKDTSIELIESMLHDFVKRGMVDCFDLKSGCGGCKGCTQNSCNDTTSQLYKWIYSA